RRREPRLARARRLGGADADRGARRSPGVDRRREGADRGALRRGGRAGGVTSDWVDAQLRRRGITDERVLEAMRRVPREEFVPEEVRHHAYDDAALPLGCGQTVSQPFVVAFICQGLALRGDERVLDVG